MTRTGVSATHTGGGNEGIQVTTLDVEVQQLIAAARIRAAHRQPFWASALFAMVPVAAPGLGTMAVDRYWRLYIDPTQALLWGVHGCEAVLLHEVAHLVRGHAQRAEAAGVTSETALMWNIATDMAINDDLENDGIQLPGQPLIPRLFDLPPNQLEEDYFTAIRNTGIGHARSDHVSHDECGSGSDAISRAWELHDNSTVPWVDEVQAHTIRQKVRRELRRTTYRGAGTWTRWALEPEVRSHDWRRDLKRLVRHACRSTPGLGESTFSRPGRRDGVDPMIIAAGRYRPIAEVAVIIDTSGSISDGEVGVFLNEVDANFAAIPGAYWVLCVDQDVQSIQRVRRVTDVVIAGGGGTDLRVGIDACRKLSPLPNVLIILTDGHSPWPSHRPAGMKVIVATTDVVAPAYCSTVRIAA